jgi:DNA topoisomerase-3
MERKGREIVPTSKGMQLVELVPGDLRSPELTAKWEKQLHDISKGKVNPEAFINEMKSYATSLVSKVISTSAAYRHDNMTREKCPECGKYLLDVNGKKGRMLVCQDRECGYRKGVSQMSNARCPECHKKLEIRGEGDKKLMVCTCGYREKLSDFKKRKDGQVNKREVSNHLHKQNEESNINSALADALSKWKKD